MTTTQTPLPPAAFSGAAHSAGKRTANPPPGACRRGDIFSVPVRFSEDVFESRLARLERMHAAELAALKLGTRAPTTPTALEAIAQLVASECGLDLARLKSRCRTEHVATARMLAVFLQLEDCGAGTCDVGNYWGRNHSTASHARRSIKAKLETQPRFRDFVAGIRMKLAGGQA